MATLSKSKPARRRKLAEMRLIRGRDFLMGSNDHYPEEAPVRRAVVGDFWIDEHPVTNAQFAAFVADTGYVTFAEVAPDPRTYPGMSPQMARAGSAVFAPTSGPVSTKDPGQWWRFVFGADWRRPLGPGSSIDGLTDHPVVQVAWTDAAAYARWAGKALPTEAEWEFAARGGLDGAPYAWGEELEPHGRPMANYWQGRFPWENLGHGRTSPVGAFPANGHGLFDMIGNVWEWTEDWYSDAPADKACCGPPRARTVSESESYDLRTPDLRIPRKVMKGGSHLCAESYCRRYRPAARYAQPVDSPTSHTGFRCVVRRA
jgi:formylglycine-generating enzyme required for sulfatase activity